MTVSYQAILSFHSIVTLAWNIVFSSFKIWDMACHWLLHGCTPLETLSFSQSLIWIFISLRKQWNSITKAFFMLNIQLLLKNAFTTLLSKWCLSNKCIKKHGVWKAGAHKPNAFEAIILHAFTAHRTESSLYCHGMSCCQLEFRLTVAYSSDVICSHCVKTAFS